MITTFNSNSDDFKFKLDNYEIDIIPELEPLIKKYKPFVYVSMHETIVGYDRINSLVKHLLDIFPFCYEENLIDKFATKDDYKYGEHNGCDMLCSFVELN